MSGCDARRLSTGRSIRAWRTTMRASNGARNTRRRSAPARAGAQEAVSGRKVTATPVRASSPANREDPTHGSPPADAALGLFAFTCKARSFMRFGQRPESSASPCWRSSSPRRAMLTSRTPTSRRSRPASTRAGPPRPWRTCGSGPCPTCSHGRCARPCRTRSPRIQADLGGEPLREGEAHRGSRGAPIPTRRRATLHSATRTSLASRRPIRRGRASVWPIPCCCIRALGLATRRGSGASTSRRTARSSSGPRRPVPTSSSASSRRSLALSSPGRLPDFHCKPSGSVCCEDQDRF